MSRRGTIMAVYGLGVLLGVGTLTVGLHLFNSQADDPTLMVTGSAIITLDEASLAQTVDLPELGTDVAYSPGLTVATEFEVVNASAHATLTIEDATLLLDGPLADYLVAAPLAWGGTAQDGQCGGGESEPPTDLLLPGESLTVCASVEMDFAAGNESQNLGASVAVRVQGTTE